MIIFYATHNCDKQLSCFNMEKMLSQKIIRFIFIGINIFFFLVGLAIFSTGIYLVTVGVTYSYVTDSHYLSGAVIIMLCGIVTCLAAILGIIGGAGQWWIILLVYFIILLIVVLLEIISGSIGFAYRSRLLGEVNEKLTTAIRDYRDPSSSDYNAEVNSFVDKVQSNFKCCGVNGTGSWLSLNILYVSLYGFPDSCHCPAPADDCVTFLDINIYNRGCNTNFYNFVEKNSVTIGSLGIVLSLVEISGLILAVMLCWMFGCLRDNTLSKKPNQEVLLT